MTPIEKLERLIAESSIAPLLTEAIDKAYEAAFPTRKLEPGDMFEVANAGSAYRVRDDGTLEYRSCGEWVKETWSLDDIRAKWSITIIGKALDEPIEVKP